MAEDQPGLPGSSNHDDRPGQRPTEPLPGLWPSNDSGTTVAARRKRRNS
jgi:hypothetical protein